MNKRIRKKKEKQSLMEYSYELVSVFPRKKRKKIVDNQWRSYHESGIGIVRYYKRKRVED